jgi:hypothetical protein
MAEKKRNWDEWIGEATKALGPAAVGALAAGKLGAMAVEKIKRDARNEAKAASFPERKTTYSRTPQEKETAKREFARALKEGEVGRIKPTEKSGSIGRESAEMARDRKRRGY